ncbi:2OG-Fe-II oxygenase family oxidoreductase [Auriculariales sp. MPI-PUGE-AT-0066]|nr:2OG-Fe-II oxygenase family oxidoreductase [Auriculariales sp. MPI-PUGE-AT-0066]KAH7106663.1 2OG-Fe-II oxygenase family oxidoreductase [Auriculariales sp. MPI-PUGE-AT-0066]
MSEDNRHLTDERVPTAVLTTIDFARLERHDSSELHKLLDACQSFGFFYLDFTHSEKAGKIVEEKDRVLAFMKNYFDQSLDDKMKDNLGVKTKGYVPSGSFTGVAKGSSRSFEHLALSRYDFLSAIDKVAPAVQEERELFKSYFELNSYATSVMLGALSDVLQVPNEERFDRGHDPAKPCDTILAMLSYPPNIGDTHQQHTDIGSMTILFSHEWGLQAMDPKSRNWEFIEPREKHAVINVGDALRFLSNKQLYSCVHRVIRATGSYACEHRYSLAFLLRPEHDLKYKDTSGKILTAREWHDNKYKIYSTPHEVQDNNALLGGMDTVFAAPTRPMAA